MLPKADIPSHSLVPVAPRVPGVTRNATLDCVPVVFMIPQLERPPASHRSGPCFRASRITSRRPSPMLRLEHLIFTQRTISIRCPLALCEPALRFWCSAYYLNHLIRPVEQRLWNVDANLLCRLETDHQLELRRLLDRQIGGLGSLEDLVHINGDAPVTIRVVRRVGYESASINKFFARGTPTVTGSLTQSPRFVFG